MWYTGNYYPMKSRVGYASSSDGFNWNKSLINPILLPNNDWEKEVGDVSVIHKENIYEMWYTSIGTYIGSGIEYYRIGHATSTDGISWLKD